MKPRFRKGQRCFCKPFDHAVTLKRFALLDGTKVLWHWVDGPAVSGMSSEHDLRPLTASEIGPRTRRRK